MKFFLFIIFMIACFKEFKAQEFLAIDVFTLGHFKRFEISQNDQMTYKLKGSSHRQTHTIVDMEDSTIYIETGESIQLKEIKKIITDRSNFLTRIVSNFFRIGGAGYIGLDAFNNAINGEAPVFEERTLVIGASLFAMGEIIHLANKKRIRVGKHARLKILNLSLN